MQEFLSVVGDYKWIIVAAIIAVAIFLYTAIKKFKPLMDMAKEHKRLEEQYRVLTPEKLNGLDDDMIIKAILFNVWTKMKDDMTDEFEVADKQNDYLKTVYAVNRLEDSFANGGFEQIYLTQSRKFGEISEKCYNNIGAPLHAEIMEKAYGIYSENREIFDKGERLGEGEIYLFDEIESLLTKAKENEDIKALCAKYIRNNVEKICE